MNPKPKFGLVLMMLIGTIVGYGQNPLIHRAGTFETRLYMPNADVEEISQTLQSKRKKREVNGDVARLDHSFVLYQQSAYGKRPFGKVYYQLELQKSGNHLICRFADFRFREYKRSARYGRMMEVRSEPKSVESMQAELNEVQWGTLQWRMERVMGEQLRTILSMKEEEDTVSVK